VASAPGPHPVVVGHSGAGVLLPLVSAALDARAVVFVDALVPAPGGATCTADEPRLPRGWRVVRLPGHHRSPMTEPRPVADALIEAVG
jgi:hypothetical protein